MAEAVSIRLKPLTEDFESAKDEVVALLAVSTREHTFKFDLNTPSTSYLFSTLGINGAIYYDSGEYTDDERLEGFSFVIDIRTYGKMSGRMHDKISAKWIIAEYIGSLIAGSLGWRHYICTEGGVIPDDEQIV